MRTFETTIRLGTRTQKVRVQANNILEAKRLLKVQYDWGNNRPGGGGNFNVYEIKEDRSFNADEGEERRGSKKSGCLKILVLLFIGFILFVVLSGKN